MCLKKKRLSSPHPHAPPLVRLVSRLALVALGLAAAGCDRTPLAPDGPGPGVGLLHEYAGTLDEPPARFFAAGLPDQPCRPATLALAFGTGTFDLACAVADGIVEVTYRDAGPLEAERSESRVTARSESGFVFEGLLAPDSTRLSGHLRNPAGQARNVTLWRR